MLFYSVSSGQLDLYPMGLRALSLFNAPSLWTTHLLPRNGHHGRACTNGEHDEEYRKLNTSDAHLPRSPQKLLRGHFLR